MVELTIHSWRVINEHCTDANKKKMFIFLWAWVVCSPQGFSSWLPQKRCSGNICVETIIGPSISAGLWVVLAWNLAEQSPDEEDHAVMIHLPCTGNFSSWNETPSGTRYELTAETLIHVIGVASHSLNSEFGRLIYFLLITEWESQERKARPKHVPGTLLSTLRS